MFLATKAVESEWRGNRAGAQLVHQLVLRFPLLLFRASHLVLTLGLLLKSELLHSRKRGVKCI